LETAFSHDFAAPGAFEIKLKMLPQQVNNAVVIELSDPLPDYVDLDS